MFKYIIIMIVLGISAVGFILLFFFNQSDYYYLNIVPSFNQGLSLKHFVSIVLNITNPSNRLSQRMSINSFANITTGHLYSANPFQSLGISNGSNSFVNDSIPNLYNVFVNQPIGTEVNS